MQWLVITDNIIFFERLNITLLNLDKKNKCTLCDIDVEEIKKQKKILTNLVACIIYITDETKLTPELNNLFSTLSGFFAANGIPLITNGEILTETNFLAKDSVIFANNVDEINDFISKKYKKLEDSAKKRLAKKKLLDRGIPFTSDCFATYIAKNKIEVVNEFLEAGMSVNSRDDMGVPMLNIACRNDNFEFVEMILNLGADLNAVSDDRGYTAVMDAVWRGNEKITKYLIEKGADLNTINKEGQSNLILAVGANRENIVKLLAENGSDPDVKDMMGMSAYTYATLFKKQRIIDILAPYHKQQ